MKKPLAIGAALAVAIALLGPAVAASANVWTGGTQNCTTNQTGVTRAYTTGATEHYPPGGGYGIFYNGGSYAVTLKSSTSAGGGTWAVTTDGIMVAAGTYAYCINGTP